MLIEIVCKRLQRLQRGIGLAQDLAEAPLEIRILPEPAIQILQRGVSRP